MNGYKETLLQERARRNVLNEPLSQGNEVAIKNFLFRKFVLTTSYTEVTFEFNPTISEFQERKYLDKETLVLPKKEHYAVIQWLKNNGFVPKITASQIERREEYTDFKITIKLKD